MDSPFAPFDPDGDDKVGDDLPGGDDRGTRLREIPLRMIIPNLITILAICAGVTGIRLGYEAKFQTAVLMVLLAAFLDGIDGRVARLLKAESRFGAEMDSLADIVNFGVAPALVLHAYLLDQAPTIGWTAAVLYAVACGIRLARFNVLSTGGTRTGWRSNYFVGVPAPAGAALVLLPVYLGFMGVAASTPVAVLSSFYTLFVAFLLVSRIPVWSGKGTGFSRDVAIPAMIGIAAFVLILASMPWETLALCAMAYLVFLPLSVRAYNARLAADLAQRGQTGA